MKKQYSQSFTKQVTYRNLQSLDDSKSSPATQILWIRNRIRKLDYNYAEIVVGATGTSKTSIAMAKCCAINPLRFDESSYVTMPREFIDRVEDSKKGDAIIWDEAGVGLGSRQWHTLSNILAGQTLQTYRERNLAVFFCTPDAGFIDIQARKLINAFTEMKRYDNNEAWQYLYKVEIDRKQGKVYYPYFNFILNGRRISLSTIRVPKDIFPMLTHVIGKDIIKNIKKKASEFKAKVIEKNKAEADQFEREKFGIEKSVFDISNEVSSELDKYKNKTGRLDWHLVAADYDLSRDKAQQVIALVRRDDTE